MTPDQCQDARHLLGWSQPRLARAVGLSPALISTFELCGQLPTPAEDWLSEIPRSRTELEQARVEFVDSGTGRAAQRNGGLTVAEVRWDELTGAEQEAFERVAHGDTSTVTADILGRLIELGLVERTRTGSSISQAGLQFLAARGISPRPWGRKQP